VDQDTRSKEKRLFDINPCAVLHFIFDWLCSSMAELRGRVPTGNTCRKRKGMFRRVMNGDMVAKTPGDAGSNPAGAA